MAYYYFDIETTGVNPMTNKIITIQYQRLDEKTGMPKGPLIILKEWESSEKEIIQQFILDTDILNENPFSFVPIGYNLGFEHQFIKYRSRANKFPQIDILSRPFIDLRGVGILMNRGEFKGSRLSDITHKKNNGGIIPSLYQNKEYSRIINYIENETREFMRLFSWLYKKMPQLREEFLEDSGR